MTGFYFTSIVIVAVILVALLCGARLAVAHAIAISLAADYFFIPPIGTVLTSTVSLEHFAIIVTFAIAAALAASSMRAAFRETIASRQHAERMLAIVSHDVRNPLATVRLAVAALGGCDARTPTRAARDDAAQPRSRRRDDPVAARRGADSRRQDAVARVSAVRSHRGGARLRRRDRHGRAQPRRARRQRVHRRQMVSAGNSFARSTT